MPRRERPILVTGAHRSGTTWIGQTVSQHPRVSYIHEPFNPGFPVKSMRLKLDTWFAYAQSSNQKQDIIVAFDNLLQPRLIENIHRTCYEAFRKQKAAGINLRTPLRFGKHLIAECFRPQRILVKDPIALISAGWLYEQYNFQVICMIRTPLAFVGSLKVAGWDFDFENLRKQDELMAGRLSTFSDSIESMCAEGNTHDFIDRATLLWNILHFVILEYQETYPNWLFIRHEDIAPRPALGFQKILEYLELDMNPHLENYIEATTSHKNPVETKSPSFQPRNSKLLPQTWKDRLSDVEISRVKASTSSIASQFYEDIV